MGALASAPLVPLAVSYLCSPYIALPPGCLSTPWLSKIEHHLVDVTPTPVFTRLEGLDKRVSGRVEMLGGVFILRRITATNMTTLEAEAQVYPCVPASQTILTAIRAGCNWSYLV